MIVVLIIGILLAVALPSWITSRETAQTKACIENLNHIDGAKNQYIMENNLGSFTNETDTVNGPEPLVPKYIRAVPVCPAGGTYNTGDYTTLPTCSLAALGHRLT
jgi:type II secretory pathway pseudopilin PulG